MLIEPELVEVWCETQDDITLVWKRNRNFEIEFVQVKGAESDQLWSLAMLCGKQGKAKTSIFEKSFANDRCRETVSFRMVTLRPVSSELKILLYDKASEFRSGSPEGKRDLSKLKRIAKTRIGTYRSPNGNDYEFWLDRTYWDVRHDERSVRNANIRTIARILEHRGDYLTEDQKTEVYMLLLGYIAEAGKADYKKRPDLKRISATKMSEWFNGLVARILHPASLGTGEECGRKMKKAGIPEDTVLASQELRRSYRREVLRPEYLAVRDRRLMEGEVLATLQRLKAQLDAGVISDSGIEFHQRCIEELKSLQVSMMKKGADLPFMLFEGCMYNVVDRCLHRFLRVTS